MKKLRGRTTLGTGRVKAVLCVGPVVDSLLSFFVLLALVLVGR